MKSIIWLYRVGGAWSLHVFGRSIIAGHGFGPAPRWRKRLSR
jgi:hypothetical protein